MPWTDITRSEHRRDCQRYPSDLTDEEWTVVHPLVPPPRPGGRPRKTDMREVLNALLYIASGGIPWRMLPKDFPPVSTVRGYFYQWRSDGTLRAAVQIPAIGIIGCDFTADGRRALAGHMSEGTVRAWFVDTEDLVAAAKKKVSRGLTDAERERFADLLAK